MSRGMLVSTNSEPCPNNSSMELPQLPVLSGKTPINKKLAFFRDNITSADEGIDDHEENGVVKNNLKTDSSDTEGEDMVSEEEVIQKKATSDNNKPAKETKSVTYK